ncbi:hypothetical protein RQP46_000032 [Phenoliferia psychrophenolica]
MLSARSLLPSCSASATRALHSLPPARAPDRPRENNSLAPPSETDAAEAATRRVLRAATYGASTPPPFSPDTPYHSSYADQGFKPTPSRGRPLNGIVKLDETRSRSFLAKRLGQSRGTIEYHQQRKAGGARGYATAATRVNSPSTTTGTSRTKGGKKGDKGKGRTKNESEDQHLGLGAHYLEPGSFVEVRRATGTIVGIYICPPPPSSRFAGKDGKVILTTLGTFEVHPLANLTYSSSSFLPSSSLASLTSSLSLPSLFSDPDADADAHTNSPAVHSAIQRLRHFTTQVDLQLGSLTSKGALDLYRTLTTQDPFRESITASQLVAILSPSSSDPETKDDRLATHYTAHSLLMDQPEQFLADPIHIRSSGTFSIRPVDDLARLSLVRSWVHSDLVILQLLRQSLSEQREVQDRPHIPTVSSVLKLVDSATLLLPPPHSPLSPLQNRDAVLSLLSDLGIAAPWEDWVLHDEPTLYADWTRTSSLPTEPSIPDAHESVRRDFGKMAVYTIDDSGAKELDDGISLEPSLPTPTGEQTWWIHVHIADPTALLSPTHPLALLARTRDHTEYFPERTLPMLPEWFSSSHHLSLGSTPTPGSPQRVLTLSTRLSASGEVLESRVEPAVVRNVRMLTYAAVDTVFNHSPLPQTTLYNVVPPSDYFEAQKSAHRATHDAQLATDPIAQSDLKTLHTLATELGRQRVLTNALAWYQPRASVSVSPSLAHHHSLSPSPQFYTSSPLISFTAPLPPPPPSSSSSNLSPSQFLVSELMVSANRTAARFCVERGLPVPFRSQPPPTSSSSSLDLSSSIYALRNPTTGEIPIELPLLHSLEFASASTSLVPAPHSVMGITDSYGYVRATSPLRRYGDMVVHWQMKSALLPLSLRPADGRHQPVFSTEEMKNLIQGMDDVDQSRGKNSKFAETFWALYVLRGKLVPGAGVDEEARALVDNLSCLPLRGPQYSSFNGFWTQSVLVVELGLRAQLVVEKESEAPAVGVGTRVRIKDIVLSNRSRLIVGLKK